MRLLSMEASHRRSMRSPEVDRRASSEGAGAARASVSCTSKCFASASLLYSPLLTPRQLWSAQARTLKSRF